jgi:hypothetical protein
MPFGAGFPAIQSPSVAPALLPGGGGAQEAPVNLVAGYPVAVIGVTTNVTAQTATITINNTQITATSSTTVALTLTAIAAAIAANSTLNSELTLVTTATSITATAKTNGPTAMYPIKVSGAGGLVLNVSGAEFDFPGNVVLPLLTDAYATPSGGVITLYAGIPTTVDPITKAYLKANGYVA